MVGLSVVLESSLRNNNNNNNITTNGKYCNNNSKNNNAQVINKLTIMKKHSQPPCKGSFPDTGFLDRCFLCSKKLLAGKDIYMYKGDTAFCSMECRSNQILMDEEEINYNKSSAFKRDNCSFSVIKGPNQSSSSSSSSKHNHKGKSSRNGANGFVF